jgi:hypothetical protein
LHFADIKNYPNLSGADLEYRAKLAEIMFCTDGFIYDALEQFVINASAADRAFSHAYANHCLIRNLSRILFDSEYVDDLARWGNIPYRRLNDAAKQLYGESREKLAKDTDVSEVIFSLM